jgi:hypothetical protein
LFTTTKCRDLQVLVVQPLGGIDHQDAEVRALDRATRAKPRVELDPFVDLRLAAQPGRIDEYQLAPMVLQVGVDRVARGAGVLGDHEPLLTQQPVHERRLADVRPPDDCHAQRVSRLDDRFRDPAHDEVEQVARLLAIHRRHRHRIARAELEELVPRGICRVVHLVHDHQERLVRVAKDLGDAAIDRVQSTLPVHDHQ